MSLYIPCNGRSQILNFDILVQSRDGERREEGCWECISNGQKCDNSMPGCYACEARQQVCPGYGLRTNQSKRKSPQNAWNSESKPSTMRPLDFANEMPRPGISSAHAYYLQHFAKNISRIALAIDYEGNGYRNWIQATMNDDLLLETILAVSSSHLARWQKLPSLQQSRAYHRRALLKLKERLQDPYLVQLESTLAALMFFISYEVFSGSNRWKDHHVRAMAWVQAFGRKTTISPFLKTWVSMVNSQSALNAGVAVLPQVEAWLAKNSPSPGAALIDPFFGCTTELPSLMLRAAQLNYTVRALVPWGEIIPDYLRSQLEQLKTRVAATKIKDDDVPIFSLSCDESGAKVLPISYLNQGETSSRAIAVAEIFRHATLIYITRIINHSSILQESEIQESVDAVISLLPSVPDVVGPGSNLGWAFVVVGAEIDDEEQREYIRSRLRSMYSLAIHNVQSAEVTLEAVWRNREAAHAGFEDMKSWQDVLTGIQAEQILI